MSNVLESEYDTLYSNTGRPMAVAPDDRRPSLLSTSIQIRARKPTQPEQNSV